jgi:hypothetical protein
MVDIFPFSALDGRIAAFVPERPKKKGERLPCLSPFSSGFPESD